MHEATVALAEYQAIEAWATGAAEALGLQPLHADLSDGRLSLQAGLDRHHHRHAGAVEVVLRPDGHAGARPRSRITSWAASGWRAPMRWRRASSRASSTARPRNGSPLGLELRLPFAIVPDMQQVLSWPVFRDRKAIVPITIGDRTVEAPGSPFHLTAHAGELRRARAGDGRAQSLCRPERANDRRSFRSVLRRGERLARQDGRSKACASSTCRWVGPGRSARATSPISAPT